MEAVIVNGTPEEIAEFLTRRRAGGSLEITSEETPTLPTEVLEWMDQWGLRPPLRPLFERLIEEALSWEGVRHRITRGRKGETRFAGRVGFLREGENEAFGFIGYRSRLVLRLDKDADISPFPDARRRNVQKRRFGVQIYVRSEEALKQALDLLRLAYEAESIERAK